VIIALAAPLTLTFGRPAIVYDETETLEPPCEELTARCTARDVP